MPIFYTKYMYIQHAGYLIDARRKMECSIQHGIFYQTLSLLVTPQKD